MPSRIAARRKDGDHGPLDGVRVIDLATSYAGPTCAMYLADLGADVIKVERPGGEDSRHWGPPFVGEDSAWYLSANRGKRSVCLDIRAEPGRQVLMRLLEDADVLVVSFNPSKLAGLGLDPETVTARFPQLVYCVMSGFGLTGPDSALPGYDLIAQARSGLMSVTGAKGGPPQRMSTALTDVMAGTVAAMTIAAALFDREHADRGRLIDIALLDAALALMAPRVASFAAGEPEPQPSDATDSVLAVYQAFPTADRPLVVAIGNDQIWFRFCAAIGRDDLGDDPELRTNAGRRGRRDELVEEIASTLRRLPSAPLLQELREAGVPCALVQHLSDVMADPQIQARRSIGSITHPEVGTLSIVDRPWRLDHEDRPDPLPPAPTTGADGIVVMREAGFSDADIDRMIAEGTLRVGVDAGPISGRTN